MNRPGKAAILVVEASPEACTPLVTPLEAAGFAVTAAHTGAAILEAIYARPPQCILLPYGESMAHRGNLLDDLKRDNVYGHLPVIVMATAGDLEDIDWGRVRADDYLLKPFSDRELVRRVRLCLARAPRDLNANPLTGLPGNVAIMREAEQRLAAGRPFAMGYLDIDNFKPFNDKYGFSRGDEVLSMTARLLANAIRRLDNPDTHVGHVGGDDFIFLTPPALLGRACEEVMRDFDLIVPSFYDDDDRQRGEILSVDRQGRARVFPLMSISIAVVDTAVSPVEHIADISARAAEVKKQAKTLSGSNYMMDRRRLDLGPQEATR